jgi:hypothetical protein
MLSVNRVRDRRSEAILTRSFLKIDRPTPKAVEKPLRGNPQNRGSHSAWKSRRRRGISTFRTASTTTTLTIVITFSKMQPPASLRSEG